MYAVSERYMLLNVVAGHVKTSGLGKTDGSRCCAVPHDYFLVLGNLLARDFSVLCCCSAHVHDWRGHAKRLVRHAFNHGIIVNYHLPLILELVSSRMVPDNEFRVVSLPAKIMRSHDPSR